MDVFLKPDSVTLILSGIKNKDKAIFLTNFVSLFLDIIFHQTPKRFLALGSLTFSFLPAGGQWAIQGAIMIPAALDLGVDTAKTAMAVAWGDAWTNMIQPFWALPLLAIAGLKVRDIMGFCVMILIWSFVPISIGLLLF